MFVRSCVHYTVRVNFTAMFEMSYVSLASYKMLCTTPPPPMVLFLSISYLERYNPEIGTLSLAIIVQKMSLL